MPDSLCLENRALLQIFLIEGIVRICHFDLSVQDIFFKQRFFANNEKGMEKVHFRSLTRKCRLASFYLHENPIFKKVRKTEKSEESQRKSLFFGWHLFCQDALSCVDKKDAGLFFFNKSYSSAPSAT